MKRLLGILLILIMSSQLIQGQVIEPQSEKTPQQLYDFYSLKQNRTKTAAWICIGSGIVMIGAGMAINVGATNANGGLWLSYVGAATTLVSIPLFIKVGNHKRKAKLYLKSKNVTFNVISIEKSNYLAIGLTIPF